MIDPAVISLIIAAMGVMVSIYVANKKSKPRTLKEPSKKQDTARKSM